MTASTASLCDCGPCRVGNAVHDVGLVLVARLKLPHDTYMTAHQVVDAAGQHLKRMGADVLFSAQGVGPEYLRPIVAAVEASRARGARRGPFGPHAVAAVVYSTDPEALHRAIATPGVEATATMLLRFATEPEPQGAGS